jgi:hypothetical protein
MDRSKFRRLKTRVWPYDVIALAVWCLFLATIPSTLLGARRAIVFLLGLSSPILLLQAINFDDFIRASGAAADDSQPSDSPEAQSQGFPTQQRRVTMMQWVYVILAAATWSAIVFNIAPHPVYGHMTALREGLSCASPILWFAFLTIGNRVSPYITRAPRNRRDAVILLLSLVPGIPWGLFANYLPGIVPYFVGPLYNILAVALPFCLLGLVGEQRKIQWAEQSAN